MACRSRAAQRSARFRAAAPIGLVLVAALGLAARAQVLPQASPAAAVAHVRVLSQDIGSRPAGTANDTKGADYIAGELQKLGYRVERQPFPFMFFAEAEPPSLTVTAPAPVTLSPVTMLYSGATPRDGVTAELVAAGLGRPEDLRDRPVEGRVVLVERGQLFFRDKVRHAAAAGAAAVVIYNDRPGAPQPGTLQERAALPAVMISQAEGRRLLELLAAGPVRVRLSVRTIVEQRMSHNIIGSKRGSQQPDEVVVVGGHRDSVAVSPGANDNASGVAAVLEAARLLAGVPTARTVHFVGFGAEELGLIGSAHYVRQRSGTVVGMVNLDMVGNGRDLMLLHSGRDDAVVSVAERVARQLGIPVRRSRLGNAGSDHVNFERAGIPAVFVFSGEDGVYHTPGDVAGRVDADLIAQAAALAAGVAAELTGVGR